MPQEQKVVQESSEQVANTLSSTAQLPHLDSPNQGDLPTNDALQIEENPYDQATQSFDNRVSIDLTGSDNKLDSVSQ